MTTTTDRQTGPALADQAPLLQRLVAGYVGHRTVAIGLRSGLLRTLADHPEATAGELAGELGLDAFYVSVWCRSAVAAGVLERSPGEPPGARDAADGGLAAADGAATRYRLAPHMETLLLDPSSPAWMAGVFEVTEAPEMFARFEENLTSGRRMWWDEAGPGFIAAVADAGVPFYTRLVPGGLAQVPGLADRLAAGCHVVDTACGAGAGLVRLARTYPECRITGVDGDRLSVDRAAERVATAGVADRVRVVCSPLEEMTLEDTAELVLNNISMHECRDIDRVTENVRESLAPGGWFVVSDFPFPDSEEELRTAAGRIMSGIQFFEAQIDDQLLPRRAYDALLTRHGFTGLGSVRLTPLHALTYARRA
ncbi:trans-aconitate 2-methyltransferase [Streptomyces sp. JJ36]|uniref:class I SAM-dependent methyltransferase n=1 Tax=Streptomyces sp. JJ36 TaxID=2736645 RepID=UPI001F322F7C|nr:class I SAM-dependent methyltransferase [Streptomyces sp. JJ36]MCF6523663.1 class I SAM-dependent methyltransferase [Streptomyces sp. JJ36]